MHDELSFEARFTDAFDRYLADAPVDIDAYDVAATAVDTATRGGRFLDRARPAWTFGTSRRLVLVATTALLLIAVLAVIAYIGSLTNPTPLGGQRLLMTNGNYDCQNLFRIDKATGASEPGVACVNRLLVAPDGSRAASRGQSGIEIIDLASGAREHMASARGAFATPAGWSPQGTWLHWVSCANEFSEGCEGFIGQPGSLATNPIPEPSSGYSGSFAWSADESTFLLWDEGGVWIGNGDGSGLARAPVLTELPVGISRDGRSVLLIVDDELVIRTLTAGNEKRITDEPAGTAVECATWSPSGNRIAAIVVRRGTEAAPEEPSANLVLFTADGIEQATWPLPVATGMRCIGNPVAAWSPEGSRLLVVPQRERIGQQEPAPPPFVITIATGAVVSLEGLQSFSFSPDGKTLAALGNVSQVDPEATEYPGTLELVDIDAGTTRSLGEITAGPWIQLVWVP